MSNYVIQEQDITIATFSKAAYRKANQTPPKERTAEDELLVQVDYRTMAFPVFLLHDSSYKRVHEGSVIVLFENGNLAVLSSEEFSNLTGACIEEEQEDKGDEDQGEKKAADTPVPDAAKAEAPPEPTSEPITGDVVVSSGSATPAAVPKADSCEHKCDEHKADSTATKVEGKLSDAKPEAVKPEPNPVAAIPPAPGVVKKS